MIYIWPRQSGKTEKIINMVKLAISEKRDYIVVAPNYQMAKYIKDKCIFPINVVSSAKELEKQFDLIRHRPIIFYDEFDFIPWLEYSHLRDGYYFTTPKSIRKPKDFREYLSGEKEDILLKVLENHNWVYESKINISMMSDPFYSDYYSPEQYNLEFKSHIL